MANELQFLTKLISSILYKKPLPKIPEGFEWKQFLGLVNKNSFTSFIYDEIQKVEGFPTQLFQPMKEQRQTEVWLCMMQKHYAEQLLNRFEAEGIRALPLKGLILRELFPHPHMRVMSDMDILIGIEKLQQSRQIMKELGFAVYRYDEHHDIYNRDQLISVELHKLLIVGEMEDYFQIGFERAKIKEGTNYIYELSKEDFYIHMIGHMAYHFANGGIGIRLVLDVRVYMDHYKESLDWDYIETELQTAGLHTFAKQVEKLADVWFLGETSNELIDELGEYIANSGYLGVEEHRDILEVVKQTGDGSGKKAKRRAVVEAIFPDYKTMTFLYPILKKVPILLPVMWLVRMVKVLCKRRKNVERIGRLMHTDDADIKRLDALYNKLDVKHLL